MFRILGNTQTFALGFIWENWNFSKGVFIACTYQFTEKIEMVCKRGRLPWGQKVFIVLVTLNIKYGWGIIMSGHINCIVLEFSLYLEFIN